MLKVTLEPVQWVMRIHPNFEADPDRYIGSASVSMDVQHVATVRALVTPEYSEAISREIKRAIKDDIGATKIIWGRRRLGRRYPGSADLTSEGAEA